jgi:hypothetical protein
VASAARFLRRKSAIFGAIRSNRRLPANKPRKTVTRLYRRAPRNESEFARTAISTGVRYAPNLRVADRHVTMRGENGGLSMQAPGNPARLSSSRFGRAQQEALPCFAKP